MEIPAFIKYIIEQFYYFRKLNMDKIKVLSEKELKQYQNKEFKYAVYLTTNLKNSKIYVGVHGSANLFDRYFGSGLNILKAINKHGIENFKKEIIAVFDNADDAYKLEAEIVTEDFLKRDDVYNLALGGFHIKCSKETKRKISEKSKGNKNMLGKTLTPEHRKAISDGQLDIVWLKNDTLQKELKAFPNTEKWFKLLAEGYTLGRLEVKEETKEKIRQNNLGTHRSIETRQKMSEKQKMRGNLQTGIVWLKNEILGKNAKAFPNTEKYERLIAEGYEPGRIISEETKKKMSLAHLKAA